MRLRVILLVSLLPAAAPAADRRPVLIDTDIGSDIDDAFALALALASPELELVGVTTVGGGNPFDPYARVGTTVDEIRFVLPKGMRLTIDDLLLYEPGDWPE